MKISIQPRTQEEHFCSSPEFFLLVKISSPLWYSAFKTVVRRAFSREIGQNHRKGREASSLPGSLIEEGCLGESALHTMVELHKGLEPQPAGPQGEASGSGWGSRHRGLRPAVFRNPCLGAIPAAQASDARVQGDTVHDLSRTQ